MEPRLGLGFKFLFLLIARAAATPPPGRVDVKEISVLIVSGEGINENNSIFVNEILNDSLVTMHEEAIDKHYLIGYLHPVLDLRVGH